MRVRTIVVSGIALIALHRPSAAETPLPRELPYGDTGVGLVASIGPVRLFLGESTQLRLRFLRENAASPVTWTALTPSTVAITSSGVATANAMGPWSAEVWFGGARFEVTGAVHAQFACDAGTHSGTAAQPNPPAPRVKRLVIVNQYAQDHVLTNSDGSPHSLATLNQAILDTGEAYRQVKYAGDEVIVLRLGPGGLASAEDIRSALVAFEVPPEQLASLDLLGHGIGDDDANGEIFEYALELGTRERVISRNLNPRKLADESTPEHPLITPKGFAAIFEDLLAAQAKVGLHHCYTGRDSTHPDAPPHKDVPSLSQALADAFRRTTIGYVDSVVFTQRSSGGTLYLPEGDTVECTPAGGVPAPQRNLVARPFAAPSDLVCVYDIRGRVVARVPSSAWSGSRSPSGRRPVDSVGRPLPNGIYFIGARGVHGGEVRRLLLLR